MVLSLSLDGGVSGNRERGDARCPHSVTHHGDTSGDHSAGVAGGLTMLLLVERSKFGMMVSGRKMTRLRNRSTLTPPICVTRIVTLSDFAIVVRSMLPSGCLQITSYVPPLVS